MISLFEINVNYYCQKILGKNVFGAMKNSMKAKIKNLN